MSSSCRIPRARASLINGKESGVTPADIALDDVTGGRVRVSKRGYRASDVKAAASQVESGVVLVKLEPSRRASRVKVSRQLSRSRCGTARGGSLRRLDA